MVLFGASVDDEDDAAADRDDIAERRDAAAGDIDRVAEQRDAHADERDHSAMRHDQDLDDRFSQTGGQPAGRHVDPTDASTDSADDEDVTADGLARRGVHAAEQRRVAAVTVTAVRSVVNDLRSGTAYARQDRRAARGDRLAARRDRQRAAQDRSDAARDRRASADDREQAAIRRQQAERPEDELLPDGPTSTSDSLTDRVARVLAGSQQRIADSRAYLHRDLSETLEADDAHTDESDGGRPQ